MKRRKAREYVLQFLYALDIKDNIYKFKERNIIEEEIESFWGRNGENDESIKTFTYEIIVGTLQKLEEIDKIIKKYAIKWNIERMISIDRNILRFSVYEILYRPDIPFQVTINEAIEIAKKYSTKDSTAFINSILDKIAKEEGECLSS